MQIKQITNTFGRVGPARRSPATMLGAAAADVEAPVVAPAAPADPCGYEAWYQDHPVGDRGPALSVMATLGVATVVGAAAAAAGWKNHRVIGGLLGALGGFGVGYGVSYGRFAQWKSNGGAAHVAGACATPSEATAKGGSPPESYQTVQGAY